MAEENKTVFISYRRRVASYIARAIADHSQAITIKPHFARACENRGKAYVARRRFLRDLVDWYKARQLESK